MKPIDSSLKLMVLKLHIEGLTNREIAKKIGISHPTVSKILDEIKKGRSRLIPDDALSQLEEIADVAKIQKELGIGDDELQATFVLGLSLKEIGLDKADLLKVANLFKGHEDEFQKIAEKCTWLVEREKAEGKTIEEIFEEANSLISRRDSIQKEIVEKAKELGGIEKEIENRKIDLSGMMKEMEMMKYLREKLNGNYGLIRKMVDTIAAWRFTDKELVEALSTIKEVTDKNINPKTLVDGKEELAFLRRFGLNEIVLKALRMKLAAYSDLEVLVRTSLSFAMEKDSLWKKAEEELQQYRKKAIADFRNEISDLRKERAELRREVENLQDQKSELRSRINNLIEDFNMLNTEALQRVAFYEPFLNSLLRQRRDSFLFEFNPTPSALFIIGALYKINIDREIPYVMLGKQIWESTQEEKPELQEPERKVAPRIYGRIFQG
ncbi:MAG: helix-turn-helix domain-containing protein [Candidatus Micrarchaeia archaeon]